VIVKSRGGNVELRAGTTLADLGVPLTNPSGSVTRAAGLEISSNTVGGIPSVTAAVRIASQAVAVLELGVYRGQGVQRQQVTSVWQSRLFAGQPNDQQTRFDFKETLEESLSYRGNAYIWKNVDPTTSRIVEWFALHPDQVLPFYGPNQVRTYYVGVGAGFVDPVGKGAGFYKVGLETILHIKGFGDGGLWIAPSPILRHRLALGASLAKLTHEAALYENSAAVKLALSFPDTMNADRAKAWRELWDDTYAGSKQAGKTAVIGGGAVITPIGLTQVDAQFIESQGFSTEEIARIFNVPQSLMGAGRGTKGDHPLTPEHEQERWLRHGLAPRLHRIEEALRADPNLFAPGASVYPMFDTSGVVRGDIATAADVSAVKVQTGQWTVDEARALDGLPPLPGGVGSIPQITPVGGAPNPDPMPAAPSNNGDGTQTVIPPQLGFDPRSQRAWPALELRQEAMTFNIPAPEVHVHNHVPEVPPPAVHVAAAELPAPTVNVNVPEQPPAAVTVNVPEQPPPVVSVAAPSVEVTVQSPRRRVTFERDMLGRTVEAKVVDDE
jgi:HK97 family phage portal protein